MSYTNTTAQSFTAADLSSLDLLAQSFGRPVTVETCADDGDAWAALVPVERRNGSRGPQESMPATDRRRGGATMNEGPVMSVQTTANPRARLVVLADDGRTVLAAGDDLAHLVALVAH